MRHIRGYRVGMSQRAVVRSLAKGTVSKYVTEPAAPALNRKGFRIWGEYDSRCWLGARPASDGPYLFPMTRVNVLLRLLRRAAR